MIAIEDRRTLTKQEAMEYLSLKRRTFEAHILPLCNPIRTGTSCIIEKKEVDAAWEEYKIGARSKSGERSEGKESNSWDAKQQAFVKKMANMKLTESIKNSGFANAASQVLAMRKST